MSENHGELRWVRHITSRIAWKDEAAGELRGAHGEIWDESGPQAQYTQMWVGSAEHDEAEKKPGTWHWPPRV